MKFLIVEDQRYPSEALEYAVNTVAPKYFENFQYETAKCYNEARQKIANNAYHLILLDHRLPRTNQGDLERTDFDRFSASLENIGYSLIPEIKKKNPDTIIIGTSSLSRSSLNGQPEPDYAIPKIDCDEAALFFKYLI